EMRDISAGQAFRLREVFAMSSREEVFVRILLREKRNLWIFRCHQQGFSGDFVIVDMSHPQPQRRSAVVVELKARALLKLGSGGLQLKNAPVAVAELIERGVLTEHSEVTIATGDKDAVLEYLGFTAV
ncbi:MAG: hypothetical protein ACI8S6_006077, partial [Myxococcota bacterium]